MSNQVLNAILTYLQNVLSFLLFIILVNLTVDIRGLLRGENASDAIVVVLLALGLVTWLKKRREKKQLAKDSAIAETGNSK
jgi:branched-subunit amino acid transport protein AzlD